MLVYHNPRYLGHGSPDQGKKVVQKHYFWFQCSKLQFPTSKSKSLGTMDDSMPDFEPTQVEDYIIDDENVIELDKNVLKDFKWNIQGRKLYYL